MLNPNEQQLFEQLGRNPVFREWLVKAQQAELKVLKNNVSIEQVLRAQGATRILDSIEAATSHAVLCVC